MNLFGIYSALVKINLITEYSVSFDTDNAGCGRAGLCPHKEITDFLLRSCNDELIIFLFF